MKLRTLMLGAAASFAMAPMAMAERGSDGTVNIIYWQAPSILNPFLSGGTKDVESASLVIEPLARYNETGEMVPFLAEEVPTVANGGVSEDLTTITWKLKSGLLWSDGTAVTSADVKLLSASLSQIHMAPSLVVNRQSFRLRSLPIALVPKRQSARMKISRPSAQVRSWLTISVQTT